jgi:arabinose operon protein AraL
MPGGAIPDAGATLAYLEHLTGRRPEVIAGKPSPLIMETARERLGLPAEQCIVIGDRLETDIRMGKEAGMQAAVVLTGVTRREDVAGRSGPRTMCWSRSGNCCGWCEV